MKKILLSSVALFGLTVGALAADLPRRTVVAPAPFVPVPVFTWTGFYVGVNAGYGFSDRNDNDDFFGNNFGFGFGGFGNGGLSVQTTTGFQQVVPVSGFNTFGLGGFDDRRNRDGFVGGGQIGYNFQFTPGSGFVVGIEADIQYTDFGRRRNDDFFGNGFGFNGGSAIFTAQPVSAAGVLGVPSGVAGFGIANPTGIGLGALGNVALFNDGAGVFGNGSNNHRSDWFATVRGRLGYAIDRLLIFGTGGVAFRDTDDRHNNFFFGNGFANGAALGGSGFFTTVAARNAGSLVTPGNNFFFNDRDRNDVGYAVGGGLEYAFTNNITAKIEGLYVSFDNDRHNNNGFFGNNVVGVSNTGAAITAGQLGFGGFDNNRNRDDFGVVRAGLNFKFGTF